MVVNNPINDTVSSGLSQIMPMERAQTELLSKVDTIIEDALAQGNPDIAAQALNSLSGISRMSGLASSKFIYTFKFSWEKFPQAKNQTFEDWAMDNCGYVKKTVSDYYKVWDMLVSHDIPKEYSERMKLLPIKSLVAIGRLWEQGWEVDPHQWSQLANAPDAVAVGKIIREIKGVKPRENSITIDWDMEGKVITAWKNGKPSNIYLQYDENDEVAKAALKRIMSDKVLEK